MVFFPPMHNACPKCAAALAPASRGTLRCTACAGMFVPAALVPYLEEEATPAGAAEHDALGGRCPADGTILSRAEIHIGDGVIHLERCSSCRGIWFDRGEWALLAERQLLENLDQVWTAEWRAKQRRLKTERDYDSRQREELGPELYDALQALAAKLKGHDRRSQALAFLREASAG